MLHVWDDQHEYIIASAEDYRHIMQEAGFVLVDAVPVAPSWRDTATVRALSADHVTRMLEGCDRRTRTGLRDYAVLKVLARLGLRRSEVAEARR